MYSELGFKKALARQFLKYFELTEIPEPLRAELSIRGFENLVDVCVSSHLAWAKEEIHGLSIIYSDSMGYDELIEAIELLAITDAITYVYAAAKEAGKPDQSFLFLYLQSFLLSNRFIEAASIADKSLADNDYSLSAAIAENKARTVW